MPHRTTSKRSVKSWLRLMSLLLLLPPLLTSMIGCSKHYVIADSTQQVQVPKSLLDQLYTDREQLLQALRSCQGSRQTH